MVIFCNYFITFFQGPLCAPLGLECYQSINIDAERCLTPCKGVYADVDRKADLNDKIENVGMIAEIYDKYKKGVNLDIEKYYKIPGDFFGI